MLLAVQGLRQWLWEFYLDQGASSLLKCLIRWDLVLQKVTDICLKQQVTATSLIKVIVKYMSY